MQDPNHNYVINDGVVTANSHAAAYAQISYQTAWLKHYYPVEYLSALLSSQDTIDDIVAVMSECRRLGIEILSPDINNSIVGFTVEITPTGTKAIRYGLGSIHGIGEKAVNEIILARQGQTDVDYEVITQGIDVENKTGPFIDLNDFFNRINKRVVNKRVVTNLIKTGAFDFIEPNRNQIFNDYLMLRKEKDIITNGLDISTFDDKTKMTYEKELLGLYISGNIFEGLPYTSWFNTPNKGDIEIAGLIVKIKKIKDKTKADMVFLELETQDGTRDVVVFSKVYAKYSSHIIKDSIIVVEGKKDINNQSNKESLIANKLKSPIRKISEPGFKTKFKAEQMEVLIREDPMIELMRIGG